MRTTNERLALLYLRVGRMQRKHDRTALVLQGSSSAVLMVVLVTMVKVYSGSAETLSLFTGSSLLGENTGGYVMVAVISFMSGTLLTAFFIRHRKPSRTVTDTKERRKEEQEDQNIGEFL